MAQIEKLVAQLSKNPKNVKYTDLASLTMDNCFTGLFILIDQNNQQ
jgi:hypothetical protein